MPIPQIQVLVLSGADESRTQNRDESERGKLYLRCGDTCTVQKEHIRLQRNVVNDSYVNNA